MRLSATAFFLVGAAALASLAAPAVSTKKGVAPKAPAKSQTKAHAKSSSTKRAVGRRTVRRRGSFNPWVGQQRPAPERIQEIERALVEKGFMTAEPDVNWDQATTDAVKRFQLSENLPADGRLSALTLIALGMAKPISTPAPAPLAALAPPVPAIPPAPAPEPKPAPVVTAPPPPPPPPPVVAPAPVKQAPVPPGKNLPLVVPDTSIPER